MGKSVQLQGFPTFLSKFGKLWPHKQLTLTHHMARTGPPSNCPALLGV